MKKNNRHLILITLIFVIFTSTFTYAESKILGRSPELIKSSMEARDLIFHRRYDDAYKVFDTIEKSWPDSPTGIAGKMSIWQLRMYENEDFRFAKEYKATEKKYKKFALRQLRAGNVPTWDLFTYGAADGMNGFFEIRQGNWWSALKKSMHAMRMFKEVRFKNPEYIDVDLGFGSYIYWRSVITKSIKFMPFFKDRRNEGIALLKKVATNGIYAKDMARGNLIFILRNEKKYDEAVKYANELLAKYPENLIFRFNLGQIKIDQKKYDEAIVILDQVLAQDPSISKVYYFKGKAYIGKKDKAAAKEQFEIFIKKDKSEEWIKKAKEYLAHLNK